MKKLFIISTTFFAALALAQSAFAMTIPSNIVTLPDTAAADIFGIVGTLFTNFWPIIAIITGVILAGLVIEIAVHAIRPK